MCIYKLKNVPVYVCVCVPHVCVCVPCVCLCVSTSDDPLASTRAQDQRSVSIIQSFCQWTSRTMVGYLYPGEDMGACFWLTVHTFASHMTRMYVNRDTCTQVSRQSHVFMLLCSHLEYHTAALRMCDQHAQVADCKPAHNQPVCVCVCVCVCVLFCVCAGAPYERKYLALEVLNAMLSAWPDAATQQTANSQQPNTATKAPPSKASQAAAALPFQPFHETFFTGQVVELLLMNAIDSWDKLRQVRTAGMFKHKTALIPGTS